MIIFTNNKITKFCQITLHTKRFIHNRKLVPLFRLTVYYYYTRLTASFRRAAVRRAAIDRYILPAGPTAANLRVSCCGPVLRLTDERTPDRCIDPAADAGSANNTRTI